MIIFNYLKSHRVFVFGLIFSFCLCFIRPISSSASSDYSNTIGTYIDGQFVDYPIPSDDLLTISDLLISETDFPISYQSFVNALDSLTLTSYFENHSVTDSSYFVDVYFYPSSSPIIYIIFYKSIDFSLSSSLSSNFLLLTGSSSFVSFGDRNAFSFNLPFSVPLGSFDFSYGYPSLGLSAPSTLNFSDTYHSNFLQYNALAVGNGYSSNFGSYVNVFLSESFYKSCCVVLSFNSSSVLDKAFIGLGFFPQLSRFHSLFNSFPLISSNLSGAGGTFSFDNSSPSYFYANYPYLPSNTEFSYSFLNHGLVLSDKPFVSPTPIPSPEWVSPTPFPTITLSPIVLTPIPQYLDPHVLGTDGNISDLNGFAGLLDNTFSNFDIFALGSSILEYVYSFSGYFSFILIIPVICLIAFALGRLNQK